MRRRVEEVAAPYFCWKMKGFTVDVASLKGGTIPFDPSSTSGDFLTSDADAFLKNSEAQEAVAHSKSVAQVLEEGNLEQYDAVFLPGGHGIV